MPPRLFSPPLLGSDLLAPFREAALFARGESPGSGHDRVAGNWAQAPGTTAVRDYIAIDESGDFDPVAQASKHAFLVGVGVHFNYGTYPAIARLFAPMRYTFFQGEEVKAAASSTRLQNYHADDFIEQLGALADAGYAAITVGVVDKLSHGGGVLLKRGFDKAALRHDFHMRLLKHHLGAFQPRSRSLRVLIDQCGLNRDQEGAYQKAVNDLLDRQLQLGGMQRRVDFLDSITVETIQIADLAAGIIRRRLTDPLAARGPERNLTDLEAFDERFAPLARNYLLCDLTDRKPRTAPVLAEIRRH